MPRAKPPDGAGTARPDPPPPTVQELMTIAEQALEAERRTNEALRSSQTFLRTVVANAPIVLYALDADGTITFADGRVLERLGLTPEAIVGTSVFALFADQPQVLDYVRRALAGERAGAVLEINGLLFDASHRPILDGDGQVTGMIGVKTDISESQQLRAALEREQLVAERLRVLDETKTTFLQAVSHDLRTPLATVLGTALTLQTHWEHLPRADMADLLGRLAGNARKLDRILTDLLDLDRLVRGIVTPRRRTADVAALVRGVVEDSDLLGEHPVHVEATPVTAAVDAPKVERIVENLLVNVVRHTPPGTQVWVRVRAEPGGVLLLVEDTGPGVPAGLREEIFSSFRQGPSASAYAPGAGIGLALVARFAGLHGGRAWVEERPGGGASFQVYLPDAPDTEPADPSAAEAG